MGLQGKVNLTSVMTEEEIKSEIRSAFMEAMGNDVSFPFTFLQTSGCGAKTLAAPSLSTSFHWNAQEVSKLGKACFYILAGKKLIVEDVKEEYVDLAGDSDDDDFILPKFSKRRRVSPSEDSPLTSGGASTSSSSTTGEPPSTLNPPESSSGASGTAATTSKSNSTQGIVRGFEGDYQFTPSPESPAFSPFTPVSESVETTKGAIEVMRMSLPAVDVLEIDVRRNFLLLDALREGRKKKFVPTKQLKVTFVGEGGVDTGGPRREFFRLLAEKCRNSPYFAHVADDTGSFFSCNTSAYQIGDYKILGMYAAMSIIQGGSGFPYFHQHVFMNLCTNVWSPISIAPKCIPDQNVRGVVDKINTACTEDALREILMKEEVLDCISDAGFTRPLSSVTFSEKNDIVLTITTYHLFLKVKAVMDQFRDGLEAVGVLKYMKKYYDLLTPLFVNETQLFTASIFKAMFTINYADNGSIMRCSEEQTYIHFMDFLDECEEECEDCTLEDICIFFSGARFIPPAGWPKKPTLEFLHDDTILPTSSTCSLVMRLPTVHKSYETFKDAMVLGIKSNDGFGGP